MRLIIINILLLLSTVLPAQTFTYIKYWVQFTDKANSGYQLDAPHAYLTQKAIDRRQKQNIAIEPTDLPVNKSYVDSLIALGLTIHNQSKWFNAVTVELQDSLMLNTIKQLAFVKQVEPVEALITEAYFNKIAKPSIVNTEYFTQDEYGSSFNQIAMLNGDYLHELDFKGEGMDVAVLDAGFRNVDQLYIFENLWYNQQIKLTWDFVTRTAQVFGSGSHGMAVLSTMAGFAPGYMVGTAPNANYYLFRTENGDTEYRIEEDNWVAAAEMADSIGIDVINSSLGYSSFSDSTMDYTYSQLDGNTSRITQAADLAARKGILVVTSAGNLGSSPWRHISAPADADSVLTVGAVDPEGHVANFSSRGPSFDGDVKPNVVAQGQSAIVANALGGIISSNGTSFSAPIMAGLVTCLWQSHPEKSNMEIIRAIEQSANHYTNPNDSMGYGIPDFYKAHMLLIDENNSGFYQTDKLPIAYPNPFVNELNVMVFTPEDELYKLEVFDGLGQRIYTADKTVLANHFFSFNIDELRLFQPGVYYVRIHTANNTDLIKVMKL